MKKVITYGTFDLLHYGHIRLLERAKALGDYLIVGVTSSDFDVNRGKINVRQSLMERIEAVKNTGLADEVIPEEYVGQKIDDIRNYDIDIFAIGSDWKGHFDYLKEYCEVIYLDRTEGISSTQLRAQGEHMQLGVVGYSRDVEKFVSEAKYVSGVDICGIFLDGIKPNQEIGLPVLDSLEELLERCDAIYVANAPDKRYLTSRDCLNAGCHILCESPIALSGDQAKELFSLADEKKLVFHEAIKTAYALAFSRLTLLVKSRRVGKVTSIHSTCTSMSFPSPYGSLIGWGPIACLPVFGLLGTNYQNVCRVQRLDSRGKDVFSKVDFIYKDACASFEVGTGVKSEGELIVAGTEGYIYVPSPWWKTDYFEMRFEDFSDNKRFFYQLAGEGIRNEIAAFARTVRDGRKANLDISREHTVAFSKLIGDCASGSVKTFRLD